MKSGISFYDFEFYMLLFYIYLLGYITPLLWQLHELNRQSKKISENKKNPADLHQQGKETI